MQYPVLKKPQQNTNKEGVQNLKFPDIIESSFISLIVGKPGSGKTHLIEQLLTDDQFYYKKFNYIFFIAPTGFQMFNLNENNSNKVLDIQWLYDKIQNIKEQSQAKNMNVLVVLDDVVADIKTSTKDSALLTLIYNRRHILEKQNGTISFIITTQKYNMCPLKIRAVLTNIIFFSLSKCEQEIIDREMIYTSNDGLLKSYMNNLKQYEFVYIRVQPYLICINFKPMTQLLATQGQSFQNAKK